jgi:hypothetical protein
MTSQTLEIEDLEHDPPPWAGYLDVNVTEPVGHTHAVQT